MGNSPEFDLGGKECALIHTGGMLPESANAVVMLEDTQVLDAGEVEIFRSVASGENVIEIGEDVSEGEIVITEEDKTVQTFVKHDVFFIPQDTVCSWKTTGYVKKYYAMVSPADD